jgi:two-component system phosphate regulon sensor histidine kinase PhoR
VEALTRDAQRLASGDLSHRVHVKGTEEINQLGQTLNHMTQQLQNLEGMRRQYVSNVSHELRTPLASIRGMAETLLFHGETDPELRERYLPRIVSQTERLARLATQFLDLAQIESGSVVKFLTPVTLSSVLSEVVATAGDRAEAEGVRVQTELPADLPELNADRDRLVQVFLNLVDNAIRYTPPGGAVTVSARRAGEVICVSVCDTGVGIPAQHLPHLFERFYRVDPARTVKSGGTGLGLSIVDQIVRAHGGSIQVESEVGRGTCFHLELPLRPAEGLPGTTARMLEEDKDGRDDHDHRG